MLVFFADCLRLVKRSIMASQEAGSSQAKPSRVLKSALKALHSSTSDVEKLAALLVLTKAVDASSLKTKDKRKLLDAIGVPFVVRLLQEKEDAYRVLGADIVCAFAGEAALCESLLPALQAFVSALRELGPASGVECASRLMSHAAGRRALVQCGLLSALFESSPPELGVLLAVVAAELPASGSGDEDALLTIVRHGLGQARAGRLKADARRGLFALLAALTELRGPHSLDEPAVALAAVELEMQLCGEEGDVPDAGLVSNCCLLLEAAVDGAVAGGDLPVAAARVPAVLLAFLDQAFQSPSWGPGHDSVLPVSRLLFRWLADDSTSMRPEVAKVLAPLLDLASSEEAMLPLVVPALCHLTADDSLRPIVLRSPILLRLCEYLTRWSASSAQQLETCAGVFLNLAVLDAEALRPFPELLDLCVRKVTANETECPALLRANLALLGLFLLRNKLRSSELSPGNVNLQDFIERCASLFASSPPSVDDVGEWEELSSLGKQVIADLEPVIRRTALGARVNS